MHSRQSTAVLRREVWKTFSSFFHVRGTRQTHKQINSSKMRKISLTLSKQAASEEPLVCAAHFIVWGRVHHQTLVFKFSRSEATGVKGHRDSHQSSPLTAALPRN